MNLQEVNSAKKWWLFPNLESKRGGGEVSLNKLNGTFYQSMDVKGRMSFPNKLREIIGDSFVVTKGIDECLFVYSLENFEVLSEKLEALPMSQARNIQRFFLASAQVVEADKQGRILVPMPLREFAHLEKDIVVAGVSGRAEIWDRSRWDEYNAAISEEDVMSSMEGLGI